MFSKSVLFVSFVRCKYQNCRDLRAFLGVKFSSRGLLRVKELTFRNSAKIMMVTKTMISKIVSVECQEGEGLGDVRYGCFSGVFVSVGVST